MSKFIVTGGAGFIGSHLVKRLLDNGEFVVVLDDLSTGFKEYIPEHKNLKFIKVDISNWDVFRNCWLQNIDDFKNVDGVFHLSALARIQPCIEEPRLSHNINITGIFNILEMMRLFNIEKIIFSSSSSIYGLKNGTPSKESMYSDCLNPYSLSKLVGEKYIKIYSELYGIRGISLRYFNVWGPREVLNGQYAPVVGIFFRQLLRDKQKITIIGDGKQKRDFTFCSDVVAANISAMKRVDKTNSGMVINVGSGRNYSIKELADMVLMSLNMSRDNILYLPPRPGEARETLADVSLAKSILDWNPEVFLEDKIIEHKEYYLNYFNI